MARRRFFVDSIKEGRAEISGEQAHHLGRVLRVEPGQHFEISDNERVFLAAVETVGKSSVLFRTLEEIDVPARPVHTILLASLTKFERFEWMIEKATEIGVAKILPVVSERTEKGLDQAAGKRLARWQRIAREASEQSRRAQLPKIDSAIQINRALETQAEYRYVLEEAVAEPIFNCLPLQRTPADRVALFVGPEGGWTDRERAALTAANWTAVSLGETILRAETAAVAGLSIVHAAWAAATKSEQWQR
jgi:16S rRNA (uracil1498-N3)-methyltransferase